MLKVTELRKTLAHGKNIYLVYIYNVIIYNLVNIWQNIEWYSSSIAKYSPENAENKVAY